MGPRRLAVCNALADVQYNDWTIRPRPSARKSPQMAAMSDVLTEQDIVNLAGPPMQRNGRVLLDGQL
jgi:hypothetical protein